MRTQVVFSPSVPDLSKTFRKTNISDSSVASERHLSPVKTSLNESPPKNTGIKNRPLSSIGRENSAGLSLINLYYDLEEEEDETRADETSDAEENGGLAENSGQSDLSTSDVSKPPMNLGNNLSQVSIGATEEARNSKRQNSHIDRYGFGKQTSYVSEEEYNVWWREYARYCIRRKRKWKELLVKSGLPMDNDAPTRFPSRSEKLKRYVRKGIPAEWRGNAWWFFARGQEVLNKNVGVYDQLLEKVEAPNFSSKDTDIIERDLHRTFPDNIHFQRREDGSGEPAMICSLRRVLRAFSIYNSKIGYCQSMNFLAGLLLLFMDEERAFWMLVIMTSRYLPGVHSVNLEGVNVNQGVLLLCIKEYLPQFWQRIYSNFSSSENKLVAKNEFLYKLPAVTLCTASWFMSCFIGVVPIESTLRIWDCLFYEGSHILFKISLAVLELSEQALPKIRFASTGNGSNNRIIQTDDEDLELFQVIQTFPKSLINPNEIFEKAIFKRRIRFNNLNQEEIDRCKKYVIAQRQKFKNLQEIMKTGAGPNVPNIKRDSKLAEDLINETFTQEGYGFKKGLNGVNWNNNIKERVRRLSRKK